MKENEMYLRALREVFDEEFESDMRAVEACEEHIFSERHVKKMDLLIRNQRKPYFKLISTAGRRAACIIIALLAIPFSALTVKAGRETVNDLIMTSQSDNNEYKLRPASDSGYPTVIKYEYYISDMPEEFKQTNYEAYEAVVTYLFENDEGDYIQLNQWVKTDTFTAGMDNEHSQVFETLTDENGQEYIACSSDGFCKIFWDDGEYLLELTSNLDKDTVYKLCRSTKIKN
ncbi:MAG: DUF4367 domain-containing protein [Ruminococcus sp.]|nr:DUF4367 domain-containing protein [Ruminococcus sp.]